MDANFIQFQTNIDTIFKHLQEELQSVRTGRATPSLVENVQVSAYGTEGALRTFASITAPDAKTLRIEPWDRNILQAIEAGIRDANLGLQPIVDGPAIRIYLPTLTEESRMKLTKSVREKMEQTKVSLRRERDKIKETISQKEKEKEISEDERFRLLKKLDEWIGEHQKKVETMVEKKIDEILTI